MAGKKAEKITEDDFSTIPMPEGFGDIAIGFAPYWTPELGKYFHAMVVDIDEADPNFVRYVLHNMSETPIQCQRGPAADAELVMVEQGEEFTCSAYASLPLYRFAGAEVVVIPIENRKLPGNEASEWKPRDMWVFRVKVSSETKHELALEAQIRAKQLRGEAIARRRTGRLITNGKPKAAAQVTE